MLSQKFFYPLYHNFDQKLFLKLKKAVKNKYEFIGSEKDKIFFIQCLFYYQLLNKNYRQQLKIIYKNLEPKTNLAEINQLTKKTTFKKDFSWVNWKTEKEMIKLVNKFWKDKKIKLIGTNQQFNEFILKYLVSIWLVDWSAPLYALLIETKKGTINLKNCNKILSYWDFTDIFNKKG